MKGNSSDTIWLFLGVIILIGVMASFSPNSSFGKAFLGVRRSFEHIFGGGVSYCPFINPYALNLFSAGELDIMGDHSLCDSIDYAASQKIWSNNEEGAENGATDAISINDNDKKKEYTNHTCFAYEYRFRLTEKGNIELVVVSGNGQSTYYATSDRFFSALKDFEMKYGDIISKDNKIAIDLLMQKIPRWQCFLIYGFLPFIILYNLLNDILTFAYMRTNTRRLIAVFASLLAVMTGAIANLVVAIANFTGISTSVWFLGLIFTMVIVSVLMGQFAVTAGVTASTLKAVQNALTGAYAFAAAASGLQLGGGQNQQR